MTDQTKDEKTKAAQDQIRQVYEDGEATMPSGNTYRLLKMNHVKRRTIFAYFTHIQHDLQRGDLWWMTTADWEKVERIISDHVTFEDSLLSKRPNHWEDYPEDYMIFVQTMLPAMSYPFIRGISGG